MIQNTVDVHGLNIKPIDTTIHLHSRVLDIVYDDEMDDTDFSLFVVVLFINT